MSLCHGMCYHTPDVMILSTKYVGISELEMCID